MNNIYGTMCSCMYTRQCTAARGMRRREWLVLIIARTATSSFASWRPWESQRTHLKTALSPLRTVQQKKLLSLAMSLIYRTGASFRVSVTVVNSVYWQKRKVCVFVVVCKGRISGSILFTTPT